ncbi:MAG: hypothetical protein GY846_18150, partial [Deltaproteobacteria bacterium]|nr:hypothetical protein [Deltaproteobacteria bacterium]
MEQNHDDAAPEKETQGKSVGTNGGRRFMRLNLSERVQHGMMAGCFTILAITGLILKLPGEIVIKLGDARELVFSIRAVVHLTFGTIMILTCIYHIFYVLFRRPGRRWLVDMLPRRKDAQDLIGNMLYLLGVRKTPPQFDRFSYKEKMEYFAMIAGSALMSLTGIILWTEFFWSRFVLDIAIVVHGMEAMMACLAVITWHMYEVFLKPRKFPIHDLWITGEMEEEEMKLEHPLYYERIM